MYGVMVDFVNIMIMFVKIKNCIIWFGYVCGWVFFYKKVIIILIEGEEIDFFGDI